MPWTPPPGGVEPSTGRCAGAASRTGRARDGAREELHEVGDAARDVAAHVVRVVRARGRRAHQRVRARMRSRKPGAKRSICASMRSVMSTVDPAARDSRPAGVLPRRRARRVEVARLHDEHERARRVLAAPHGGLRGGDLVERAAEVHGAARGTRGPPRDRPSSAQSSLKTPGPVAVAPKSRR